jgi:hypothetical protein
MLVGRAPRFHPNGPSLKEKIPFLFLDLFELIQT